MAQWPGFLEGAVYTDAKFWSRIRRSILSGQCSIREVSRTSGVSRNTIRRMLSEPAPRPYSRVQAEKSLRNLVLSILPEITPSSLFSPVSMANIYRQLKEHGFQGSYSTVRRALLSARSSSTIWESAFDRVISLDREDGSLFLSRLASVGKSIPSMQTSRC